MTDSTTSDSRRAAREQTIADYASIAHGVPALSASDWLVLLDAARIAVSLKIAKHPEHVLLLADTVAAAAGLRPEGGP